MQKLLVLIVFNIFMINAEHNHDWNYEEKGPDVWYETYPLCGGQYQSPINILTACTVYKNFTPFSFGPGYGQKHNFTIKNNGHTIVGVFNSEFNLMALRIVGGDLNGTFEFVNFHLHWGENHKSGSEHEVNANKYPGEIHFVYQNPITNQMAVLGIFMKSQSSQNESTSHDFHPSDEGTRQEWLHFFDIAQSLTVEDNFTIINLNLSLLMGENLNEFWRYEGSLTTPPCTEGIVWTIFRHPIMFIENEFKEFRDNIYFEDYRRPQPLYKRKVFRNFFNETLSTVPDYNCCSQTDVVQPTPHTTSSNEKHYSSMIFTYSISLAIFTLF